MLGSHRRGGVGSAGSCIDCARATAKYVEYAGGVFVPGEVELYDLAQDPFELPSLHADPATAAVRAALAVRLRELNPTWPSPMP